MGTQISPVIIVSTGEITSFLYFCCCLLGQLSSCLGQLLLRLSVSLPFKSLPHPKRMRKSRNRGETSTDWAPPSNAGFCGLTAVEHFLHCCDVICLHVCPQPPQHTPGHQFGSRKCVSFLRPSPRHTQCLAFSSAFSAPHSFYLLFLKLSVKFFVWKIIYSFHQISKEALNRH